MAVGMGCDVLGMMKWGDGYDDDYKLQYVYDGYTGGYNDGYKLYGCSMAVMVIIHNNQQEYEIMINITNHDGYNHGYADLNTSIGPFQAVDACRFDQKDRSELIAEQALNALSRLIG